MQHTFMFLYDGDQSFNSPPKAEDRLLNLKDENTKLYHQSMQQFRCCMMIILHC